MYKVLRKWGVFPHKGIRKRCKKVENGSYILRIIDVLE